MPENLINTCFLQRDRVDVYVRKTGSPLGWLLGGLSRRKAVSKLLIKKAKVKSVIIPIDQAVRDKLAASRKTGSNGIKRSKVSLSGSGDYKLHIVMDKASITKLRELKVNLEASTDSEVIRRALKAYEFFEPDDEAKNASVGPNRSSIDELSEHLYVRIPSRMKERLDEEQKSSGRSYGEQVRQALRVLTQLTKDLENHRRNPNRLTKGELNAKILKLAATF